MNSSSRDPLLSQNGYNNERFTPVQSPLSSEIYFNGHNDILFSNLIDDGFSNLLSIDLMSILPESQVVEVCQPQQQLSTSDGKWTAISEFLVRKQNKENRYLQLGNAPQQCNAEYLNKNVFPTSPSTTNLCFYKVKEKNWMFPSQPIKKDPSLPEMLYNAKPPITDNFYLYVELFEKPRRTSGKPRLSVHKLQRTEDQTTKPIFAQMDHQGGGVYKFSMPNFKLIKTKNHYETQRSVWRTKYRDFHDIVGFNEFTPMRTEEQVGNLISKHLLEHADNYEYVCLGAYICKQYTNDDGAPYYRVCDGPFFSEKLASL